MGLEMGLQCHSSDEGVRQWGWNHGRSGGQYLKAEFETCDP